MYLFAVVIIQVYWQFQGAIFLFKTM